MVQDHRLGLSSAEETEGKRGRKNPLKRKITIPAAHKRCDGRNKCAPQLVSFLQPPIIPKVAHEGDTSNFDVYPEEDWKKDPLVSPKDLEIFENF